MHLSIIFLGTPTFACPSLRALHNDPAFTITHVITQPDRPVGRKQIITSSPVKILAEEFGIPVLQPENINKIDLPDSPPDFLVVVAYGQKLSSEVLTYPKIAPVNLHASLLPCWRGASPIHHAILHSDKETGVTVQHMVEEIDAGPILGVKSVPITERETTPHLHDLLSEEGAKLLCATLKKSLTETPQPKEGITLCGKLTRENGQVDPSIMTAEYIDSAVRALVPWPGVTMESMNDMPKDRNAYRGTYQNIKLIQTSLKPHPDAFELACAKGTTLYITKMQTPGKNVVTGKAWKNHKK